MKKILFPTDFSKSSLNTLDYACKFCKKINAEIVLFHAMLAPVVQIDGPILTAVEIMEKQTKNVNKKLRDLTKELRSQYNIVVNHRAEYGFSAETICEISKKENIELIILSSKGESNLLDKIFGNVTLALFKNAQIPVFSIPEKAKFENLKNIVFASSNIDYDAVQIFDLMRLTSHFKPKITLVHIQRGNEFEKETFEEYKNLEYIEIEGNEDNKAKKMLEYLESNPIDLVCVKKYKLPMFYRLFHQSFTEKLFYHANIPLLVFKDA